jgi:translation initiation factor IF-2
MSIRVHQLAKELNISSAQLLAKLRAVKVDVKSHMSVLNDEVAKLIKEELTQKLKKGVAGPKKEIVRAKKTGLQTPAEKGVVSGARPSVPEAEAELLVKEKKKIQLGFPITSKELALKLSLKPSEFIQALIRQGVMVSINQSLSEKMVKDIGERLGFYFERLPTMEEKLMELHALPQDSSRLIPRPPIVTFMGHVDHGKTSLLDAIRLTKITEKEAGGITQHIGAYEIDFAGKKITFLDTPGHEAFTAMRARGANVTDIVVLVVAADDGIMPQTIEAIDHARAADVPIVVAINKIDKPQANLDKVKRQLQELNLTPEDWGGKTIAVPVSAKTRQGIDTLLEMILLEAELLELKADPGCTASGAVLESKISKGGPQSCLLVQNGTLRLGDVVLAGEFCGKVKAMFDDRGKKVETAAPATPVEVLGILGAPEAGEKFYAVSNESAAREIAQSRQMSLKEKGMRVAKRISLEDLHQRIIEGEEKEVRLILKADVQGSLEAVKGVLEKIPSQEIKLNILHEGIGEITESDVSLACASDAIVFGFHTTIDSRAQLRAKIEGVDIRIYQIIYEVFDEIKKALEGMLEPKRQENFLGRAEVKQVFRVSKIGVVAGAFVVKGKIVRNAICRVLRNNELIHKGRISSLKRFKDDVREVQEGFECGISVDNFNEFQVGDLIEVYEIEEIARKL